MVTRITLRIGFEPCIMIRKGPTMRFLYRSSVAAAVLFLAPTLIHAQEEGASRSIAGGGISVPGWTGKVDASETKAGKTVNDAKFDKEGSAIHVITGPETRY